MTSESLLIILAIILSISIIFFINYIKPYLAYFINIKKLRIMAEQGNPRAQYCLGVAYDAGKSVAKDNEEAVKWFKLAANQGLHEAIEILRSLGK